MSSTFSSDFNIDFRSAKSFDEDTKDGTKWAITISLAKILIKKVPRSYL